MPQEIAGTHPKLKLTQEGGRLGKNDGRRCLAVIPRHRDQSTGGQHDERKERDKSQADAMV